MKRIGDLEIEEDEAYQRRFHIFQRASWTLMILVIAAALAGLIGPGLKGTKRLESVDKAFRVEFERTTNYQKDSAMSFTVKDADAGSVSIWLSRDFLDSVRLEQVIPEPERVMAGRGKVYFDFINKEPGDLEVRLYYQPVRIGRVPARSGRGTSELEFSQFVFP